MGIDKTFEERNDLIKFVLAKECWGPCLGTTKWVGCGGCGMSRRKKKITNHYPYSLIMKRIVQSVKERMSFIMVEVKKGVNGN